MSLCIHSVHVCQLNESSVSLCTCSQAVRGQTNGWGWGGGAGVGGGGGVM